MPSAGLRQRWAFDASPRWIALAQTVPGRAALVALFALLLAPTESHWLPISAGAAVVAYAGERRLLALLASTALTLAVVPFWFNPYPVEVASRGVTLPGHFDLRVWMLAGLALALLFCFALIQFSEGLRKTPLLRRPVASLLLFFVGLLLLVDTMPHGVAHVVLWAFICAFGGYFWFLQYALADRRAAGGPAAGLYLGSLHPMWNVGTAVPVGKGLTALRKAAAKTPEELAVTQLKALKLLLWSTILRGALWAFERVIFSELGIPRLGEAFAADQAGAPVSLWLGVASVVAFTFHTMLSLAIVGHRVVAIARLAGFRLLRNTWRPLESRSLADYWNRYYFFFKEVMADMFFYPAFLGFFKKQPKLRVFFATFLAAGVGNLLFHFLMDIEAVALTGLWPAMVSYQSMAFYMVALATGIGVSQLRATGKKPTGPWLTAQLLPRLGLWSYVCLLQVFSYEDRALLLKARFLFLGHLVSP